MRTRLSERSIREWATAALLAAAVGACATRTAPATRTGTGLAAPGEPSPELTATPKPVAPAAARIPDQPYVGTPRPMDKPYLEILRLKQRGESNESLLARVRADRVVYSLSTFDIQRLRSAGISEDVIAAMLASGREARTPTPRAS